VLGRGCGFAWQLDITGSVFLADGTELKLISGIDDHSRFCVIATAVRRGLACPPRCPASCRRAQITVKSARCAHVAGAMALRATLECDLGRQDLVV
jgi:hypothetical protein